MNKDCIKEAMQIGYKIEKLTFECVDKNGFRYCPHYVKLPLGAYIDLHPHPDFIAHNNGIKTFHDLILCPTQKITDIQEMEVF